MGLVTGAQTNIHFHMSGAQAVAAAIERARNSTIVIGADQDKGVMLIDIDIQEDICSGVAELQDHLRLVIEALNGFDPFADDES